MKVGDRIKLVSMADDPDPIEAGATGTIDWLGEPNMPHQQIGVEWDNGRSLILINGVDKFRIITGEE